MPHSKILCQTNLNDILVSMNSFKEIVKFTLIALIIIIPFRTFIAQPFIVSGPSMDPTFATGQYLIVDQISYRFNDPERNDVIVFRYPGNPKIFYIKRIIGLPGETVSVDAGTTTIINKEHPLGIVIPNTYTAHDHLSHDTFTKTLDANSYFVMGDNRTESADSRLWGPLPKKYIVGKPFLRLFPLSKLSVFPGKQ